MAVKYNLYKSKNGQTFRLEIGQASYGFTPAEFRLFAETMVGNAPDGVVSMDDDIPRPMDNEEVLTGSFTGGAPGDDEEDS